MVIGLPKAQKKTGPTPHVEGVGPELERGVEPSKGFRARRVRRARYFAKLW